MGSCLQAQLRHSHVAAQRQHHALDRHSVCCCCCCVAAALLLRCYCCSCCPRASPADAFVVVFVVVFAVVFVAVHQLSPEHAACLPTEIR
jgi:hypothetical protein